jgi:glycosyltransferase involved in cell wall biosynthesis
MTAPAALERLRDSRLPRILFVAHAFGGGVARHIEALARAVAADAEVLLLQPHVEGYATLRWLRSGEDFAFWFRPVEDWDRASALLDAIGIDRIHYHHVHGWPQSILALPHRLGCAHDVTLHDYYPACPAYHLTGANGRYCGGAPDCGHCLDGGPAQWPVSIPAWRDAFRELLGSAARIIAPSRDAAQRIARFFPGITPVVWPHPEDDVAAPPPAARVLVPGAIPPAKGLDVLEACVRDAAARGLPLHFRVLGYTSRPIASWPALPYSVAGEYREGDLPALIALEGGDALFFPAQCPETYSYTLTAALASGLPVVATDLGALPERLAAHPAASIVPWDAPAAAMNDAILAVVAPRARPAAAAQSMTPAAYRTRYLEGIARGPEPRGKPDLDPAWLVEPHAHVESSSLAWLFQDGVRAGRGKSLAELERRTGEADLALTVAAEERIRMQAALAAVEAKASALAAECRGARAEQERLAGRASAAEERLRQQESSRSWRMTAPLRAVLRRLRGH